MFCPNCGNRLLEGVKFCSKCGCCIEKASGTQPEPTVEEQVSAQEIQKLKDSPMPNDAKKIKKKKNKYLALMIVFSVLIVAGAGVVYVMKQKNDTALPKVLHSEFADREEEIEASEEREEETQAVSLSETLPTVAETPPALPISTSAVVPVEPVTISPALSGQPITCTVQYSNQFNRTGLIRAGVRKETVTQSSYVVQQDPTIDNSGWSAFDGQNVTSWQENASGDGIGEYVYAGFDQQYQVRAITLLLGNHRSDSWYIKNNTPKTLTINMGDQVFQASFPQEKTEFVMVFSTPVSASDIKLTIDEVYAGTEYSDTIIAEVGVYGN